MSRALDDLSARMKPLAMELIARAVEANIAVTIVETLRTEEQQLLNLERGVSWTRHSKHLTGDAIDLAPTVVLGLKNWAPLHPKWKQLVAIAKKLGLACGADWQKTPDNPHFEFVEKEPEKANVG